MAARDLFDAIGLGQSFTLAAITFGFFNWLDRNASAQAVQAISGWLRANPIVELAEG
jgi:hypothetical protein